MTVARLGASLRKRHVTMISLGIIGAGLFAGSSATMSAMGPRAHPRLATDWKK
jgi:GABA permease